MTSILRRSHYNLRPRTARVTSYQTIFRSGQCTTVFRLDLETNALAAQAQERHEEYLAGHVADGEDPEVEESDEAVDAPTCAEGTSLSSSRSATTRPIIADTIQDHDCKSATTSCNPKRRAARTKDFSKTKKRHARVLEGAGARYSPYVNRSTKASAKIKKQQAEAIHTKFAWTSSVEDRTNRVAKTAMVGVRLRTGEYPKEPETKEQSLKRGLDEINWDGEHDMTIVDAQGRVVVYLARKSADMDPVLTRVERQFEKASEAYRFKPSQIDHRRGKFKAAPCAASYGSGQQRVGNLKDSVHNKNVLERELLKNDDIINLAGFVDAAFQNAAYDLHEEYGRVLTSICGNDRIVRRNFTNSVFAGATFNFGPQAATVPHTDHLNIPTGWCAVVALGDFNADEGGHLILWDLNLLIRFPRGAIIFLPSALFVHSNTLVPEGQRRYSFTQYTAGGLARWVECGFRSQKQFLASGGTFARTPQQRWEEGLALFPRWDSWGSD